ncbi:hypothetical protein WJX72_000405 [[Myrmecia] bisecta]|uniref:Glycoside hydrolase family 5 domain-containing protein n=1 Tax=[Myrmecia] bisecta TaxID=41462 RepID=A0AAW1PMU2_9CHLO
MELTSTQGALYLNGQRFYLKGTSWFGFEGGDNALHGLWSVTMHSLLDFLQQNGFNALRIPVSAELSLELDRADTKTINFYVNPQLKGLSAGGLLDLLVAECARRGILIMLDMHHVSTSGGICELWYDDKLDEAGVICAWQALALRYKDSWNVFAADLNNEPHGCASWGTGDPATDWRLGAQRVGDAIHEVNPRLLLFVEGTAGHCVPVQAPESAFWGEALDSAAERPVSFRLLNKLVYSPHVYGPDVAGQAYFKDPRFPANMPAIWTRHWAHLKLVHKMNAAIVPGEWGGRAQEGSQDRVWQEAFANFLHDNGITDNFYWCLNPNSGDTGGLLKDDWVTPEQWKLDLLAYVNPRPTRLQVLPDGRVNAASSEMPKASALDLQSLAQAMPAADDASMGNVSYYHS